MLKKIWSANDNRKSRFHDRHGQMVPPGRILKNFPRALASAIRIKLTGGRAVRPWISYDAADLLEAMLNERPCDILDLGQGCRRYGSPIVPEGFARLSMIRFGIQR